MLAGLRVLVRITVGLGLGLVAPPSWGEPFLVWMASEGSDANSGLDEGHPVKTLGRVHAILQANLQSEHRDAEVRIAHGTYLNDSVDWRFTMDDHYIKFTRWPDGPTPYDRPLFKSVSAGDPAKGAGGTWFHLRYNDQGQPSNLVFWYLRVEHYDQAIDFDGSVACDAWNGYNTVYGCYFYEIGTLYTVTPSDESCTGCIRMQNSRNNLIQNNHFVRIQTRSVWDHLHAIYVSDYSSNNMIKNNRFKTVMGDPIRVRNASNWNRVTGNRFVGCGQNAAVSEWLCLCPD